MKKAYLIFENGEVVEGIAAGAERESVGEAVFTTGTVGYLETLTDPSYAGQIVIQTFPMIGNYGVIPEDFEGVIRYLEKNLPPYDILISNEVDPEHAEEAMQQWMQAPAKVFRILVKFA